jgi:hypothetical protein
MLASRNHSSARSVLSPRIKQESAKSTFAGSKFDVYGLKFMVERATLLFVANRGQILGRRIGRAGEQ